jgi:hypothetical protein
VINGAGVTGYYARVMSRGVADSLAASTFKLRLAFFVESLCDNTAHLSSTRPRPKFQGDCRHQMPKFEPRWPGAAAGRRPLAWPRLSGILPSKFKFSRPLSPPLSPWGRPPTAACQVQAECQRPRPGASASAGGASSRSRSCQWDPHVMNTSLSAQRRSRLPS